MLTDRALPFRHGLELLAWGGLVALFVLVQLAGLPSPAQTSVSLFLLVLGAYLFVALHVLFPRSHYAPQIIYATLVLDVFIVGALRLVLGRVFPGIELGFIVLIVITGMVADWRGTLALAVLAALVEMASQPRLLSDVRQFVAPTVVLNQLTVAGAFALIGLVVVALVQIIQRRAAVSTDAVVRETEAERQQAERSARRWELVNAVGLQVQSRTRPAEIFQAVGAELRAHGLDCFIGLTTEEGDRLRVAYVSLPSTLLGSLERLLGVNSQDLRIKMNDLPLLKQAMADRRAVFSDSTNASVRRVLPKISDELLDRLTRLTGLGKDIIAPLAGSETHGMLCVWGHDLEPADIPAMTGLAQHIAVALEKAHLFAREQKRVAELGLVQQVAERAAGMFDPDELMEQVPRLIVERFGFENVEILLNDVSTREVVVRSHAGAALEAQAIGYRQSWDVGLIGYAVRNGETVLVNDVHVDNRYFGGGPGAEACNSELCVPLKRSDQVLGVLDVQSSRIGAFETGDVAAMETLANQVAAGLDKARLYRDLERRLAETTTLYQFSQALSETLEPVELARRAMAGIQSLLHYQFGDIFLIDKRDRRLVPLAPEPGNGKSLRVGEGIRGWVAENGRSVRSGEVGQNARYVPMHAEIRSELCIPLQIGDRIVGVLNVESTRPDAFSADDERLLTTLATPLAMSIENARLYSQTKGEAEVKTALLRELSHRVKNHLAAIAGLLYLRLDDDQISRQEILSETLSRVQSMAVAHTLLAESPRARVDLLDLGRRVVGDCVHQMTLPGQVFNVTVGGESIDISAHQAASIALVLNELVTNAIKHSSESSPGQAALTVERIDGQARLTLVNQGQLPAKFNVDERVGGLGLQLIRTLVEKDLNGTLMLSPCKDGVQSVVCFEPESD